MICAGLVWDGTKVLIPGVPPGLTFKVNAAPFTSRLGGNFVTPERSTRVAVLAKMFCKWHSRRTTNMRSRFIPAHVGLQTKVKFKPLNAQPNPAAFIGGSVSLKRNYFGSAMDVAASRVRSPAQI